MVTATPCVLTLPVELPIKLPLVVPKGLWLLVYELK
jgi:hypothetical protein